MTLEEVSVSFEGQGEHRESQEESVRTGLPSVGERARERASPARVS
jgi:hypothetical protein